MAAGIFRNFDLTTLTSMLGAEVTRASTGNKVVISYTEAGRTVTKQFQMTYKEFMDELNWALSHKDPDTYGPNIGSTRVKFNNQ